MHGRKATLTIHTHTMTNLEVQLKAVSVIKQFIDAMLDKSEASRQFEKFCYTFRLGGRATRTESYFENLVMSDVLRWFRNHEYQYEVFEDPSREYNHVTVTVYRPKIGVISPGMEALCLKNSI